MRRLMIAAGASLVLVLTTLALAVLFAPDFDPVGLLAFIVLQNFIMLTAYGLNISHWEYPWIPGVVVAWMAWTGIIYGILCLHGLFAGPRSTA